MAVSYDIVRMETAAGRRTAALIHDSAQTLRVESPTAAPIVGDRAAADREFSDRDGAGRNAAGRGSHSTTGRRVQPMTAPAPAATAPPAVGLATTPAPVRGARAYAREGAPPDLPANPFGRPPAPT